MTTTAVDADGVAVPAECDATLDVLFDGQRVWSFDPARDGQPDGVRRRVRWPAVLKPYLDGVTRVTVTGHVGSRVQYDEEVRFGSSDQRVRVVNARDEALTVSKWGKLERMFDDRRSEVVDELVAAIDRLLQTLRDRGGVEAFLAFGGLLGAVREGRVIGHDTDGDVGYLSHYTHPLDVVRESYQLERVARKSGFHTLRASGGSFKALISTVEGRRVGIDVFAGFYVSGTFHMLPGVRGELPQDALVPVSTVSLEGRELPAPADPPALLELTYGPGWRVPDPAFQFSSPPSTTRRFDSWIRGAKHQRAQWERFTRDAGKEARLQRASPFAAWVISRGELAGNVVDLGCGTGRDAFAFANAGAEVIAMDYAAPAGNQVRRRAERQGLAVRFEEMNLYDTRSVLIGGARLVHDLVDEPIDLYARFLLSTLSDFGRFNFWLLAKMLVPQGGRFYLEFRTTCDMAAPHEFSRSHRRFLDPDVVIEEAGKIGAVVEDRREGQGLAPYGTEDPHVCQLVLRGRGA